MSELLKWAVRGVLLLQIICSDEVCSVVVPAASSGASGLRSPGSPLEDGRAGWTARVGLPVLRYRLRGC